jgi:hypothetical protein
MAAQVNYGLNQVAQLQSKENDAILAAQQAGQAQDFALQDKINTQISNIRDTKVAAAQKVQDIIDAQNQALAAQKAQTAQDNAITEMYQQGVTDIPTIMSHLQSLGMNPTTKDIGDALTTIEANDATMKDAAANQKIAQTVGVTTQFVNQNGKFYNANTGQTFETVPDFLKASGASSIEDAYAKGLITDVSNQQLDDIQTATAAAAKYPDAGINPNDDLATVASKLQNSALYRKDTYIAPTDVGAAAALKTQITTGINNQIADWENNNLIAGNGTVSSANFRTAKNNFVKEYGADVSNPSDYFDQLFGQYVDKSGSNWQNDYDIGTGVAKGNT